VRHGNLEIMKLFGASIEIAISRQYIIHYLETQYRIIKLYHWDGSCRHSRIYATHRAEVHEIASYLFDLQEISKTEDMYTRLYTIHEVKRNILRFNPVSKLKQILTSRGYMLAYHSECSIIGSGDSNWLGSKK